MEWQFRAKGVYKSVTITLPELTILDDFLLLDLGRVDVILGMTWLCTMGFMGVRWPSSTMTFFQWDSQVMLKGDLAFKAEVTLKSLTKTWEEDDLGFLLEFAEIKIDDEGTKKQSVLQREDEPLHNGVLELLEEYQGLFETPKSLPSTREVGNHMILAEGQGPIPYKYGHSQKNEMEKLIKEMLTA